MKPVKCTMNKAQYAVLARQLHVEHITNQPLLIQTGEGVQHSSPKVFRSWRDANGATLCFKG